MTAQLDLLTPLGRGLRKRDASAAKHSAELEALVPKIRAFAKERGDITVADFREHLGWLTSKGRELAWLGKLPEAAGLIRVGMRRSHLKKSGGNWQAEWRLP